MLHGRAGQPRATLWNREPTGRPYRGVKEGPAGRRNAILGHTARARRDILGAIVGFLGRVRPRGVGRDRIRGWRDVALKSALTVDDRGMGLGSCDPSRELGTTEIDFCPG